MSPSKFSRVRKNTIKYGMKLSYLGMIFFLVAMGLFYTLTSVPEVYIMGLVPVLEFLMFACVIIGILILILVTMTLIGLEGR